MRASRQPQQAATGGAQWLQRLKQRVALPEGQEPQQAANAAASAAVIEHDAAAQAQRLHAARAARFTERGLNPEQAGRLADALTQRDGSDYGDMVTCFECRYCQRGKYCTMWQAAGIGRDLGSIATMLQRCPAFAAIADPSREQDTK